MNEEEWFNRIVREEEDWFFSLSDQQQSVFACCFLAK